MADKDDDKNPLEGIKIPPGPPLEPRDAEFEVLHDRIDRLEEVLSVQLAGLARRNSPSTTNIAVIEAQVASFRNLLRTRPKEPDGAK